MASKPRTLLSFTVLSLLVALAAPASAEPTAAEKETARALMAQGRTRRARSDHAGALESFRAADSIMKVPTTGLEVAREEVGLGRLVEARDTLRRVLRIPQSADEPKPFREARAAAQSLDEEVASRIPTVRVTFAGPAAAADIELEVDGVRLPKAAAQAPLRLNPGKHTFAAYAPRAAGRADVTVAERETRTVAITLETLPGSDEPAPTVTSPLPEPAAADSDARPFRTAGWVTLGVGGAGLVVGAVTGGLSLAATSRAKSACVNGECPPETQDDLDYARTTANVSTAAFIAGGVVAAAGVGMLLFLDKPSTPALSGTRVVPWLGLGSAGLRGQF